MSTPITCKLNNGKPIVFSGNLGKLEVEGSLDLVFNHRTGDVTDVVGFEIFMYCKDKDSMSFTSGSQSTGSSPVWYALEKILGDTLVNIAKEHCDHEPPTDGTLEEQQDYEELLDDFYPPMPRG